MGLHSPSFSHVDVSDLPTESGSASKRWEELRQPTAEVTDTCAYEVASTVICFVLATAESDGSLSKGLRKLWYSDKLYSDVRDLLNGRVRRVSRLHGLEGYRSEWRRFLVFGIVVSRLARAGRDSGPTSVLRRQLDVFLGRGPPLLPKSGISRARLRNFAAWQVTDRTNKPAFSKYRLSAIGDLRSASQTVQERQLGNEQFFIRFRYREKSGSIDLRKPLEPAGFWRPFYLE
jgi:hypothetical protein